MIPFFLCVCVCVCVFVFCFGENQRKGSEITVADQMSSFVWNLEALPIFFAIVFLRMGFDHDNFHGFLFFFFLIPQERRFLFFCCCRDNLQIVLAAQISIYTEKKNEWKEGRKEDCPVLSFFQINRIWWMNQIAIAFNTWRDASNSSLWWKVRRPKKERRYCDAGKRTLFSFDIIIYFIHNLFLLPVGLFIYSGLWTLE